MWYWMAVLAVLVVATLVRHLRRDRTKVICHSCGCVIAAHQEAFTCVLCSAVLCRDCTEFDSSGDSPMCLGCEEEMTQVGADSETDLDDLSEDDTIDEEEMAINPVTGRYKTRFMDDELVEAMRHGELQGNMLTFYKALPEPERRRLFGLAHGIRGSTRS